MDLEPAEFPIGIIGSGVMGRGIAQVAALAGFPVLLHDAKAEAVPEAIGFVGKMIARLAEKGQLAQAAADKAAARVHAAKDLQAFSGCKLAVEAIIEQIEPKQKLFQTLEGIVTPDAILASNTSSLSITAIASGTKRPERVAGFHFFNPVPLMRIVEAISAVRTDPAVVDTLVAVAKRIGFACVRCQDTPGFLVNHAGRAFGTEALRIVQEGIADMATVDNILREAAQFRMGPFELMDLTALDVSYPAMVAIYSQYYQEPRYRPSPLIERRFTAGLYGRKAGRGWYEYKDGAIVRPSEPPVPSTPPKRVWIGPGDRVIRSAIGELASRVGAEVDGTSPGADSLCIVLPLGDDTTTTAKELNLDPKRTVAVDAIYGLKGRRTLMTTPVTEPAWRDAAHALLAVDEVTVSVIHDSPGFVTQRVVAMIVNLGCDIAQQRVAAPADIDTGVKLGLGYPDGPLALGDKIGPSLVLTVLERLHAFYGDPRYRPSPWLKRRAMLGVSLLTPEA
jgi:3-hydroxybutyryl-CoA dehydrogenase